MLATGVGCVGHHRGRACGRDQHRPVQLVKPVWKGTAFGGAKEAQRTVLEMRRLVYGRQRSEIDR